ncbi:adenylate/guanylate cyclase domain-containing protein [Breoghania sp.]|uniref:adenylate/guanylate cyclase domain-containing protein n=1 Tax=Breoghania sp. TaxID=2065378 RepID=UPI00260350A4|nr:adenylate/guanylate cyclase domain-containing protein [Breoghania sp.]MDJ0931323.1 adenylate/guanylate cyclase domain-containing protein [Breoghania sp.]
MNVEAVVLVVDIRGFSQVASRLPPETVMRILSCYQGVVVPVIQRRGGGIDKFLGDGILATFGALAPSQTYAADALAVAMEIIAVINASQTAFADAGWPGKIRVGVAMASGELTIGVVGVADRLEYTVIGTPVNLAAKLEDANKGFNTCAIAAADTYELARNQGIRVKALEIRRDASIPRLEASVDVALLVNNEGKIYNAFSNGPDLAGNHILS